MDLQHWNSLNGIAVAGSMGLICSSQSRSYLNTSPHCNPRSLSPLGSAWILPVSFTSCWLSCIVTEARAKSTIGQSQINSKISYKPSHFPAKISGRHPAILKFLNNILPVCFKFNSYFSQELLCSTKEPHSPELTQLSFADSSRPL